MIRCARCHRPLRNPVHIAGMALGVKCAAAVQGPRRVFLFDRKPKRPDERQRDLFEVHA